MVTYKKRKNRNMRGSQTHGWGAKKKHRGAGSRGGRGMAGTGKRGDAKKPCIWKDTKYFGKHGFSRPTQMIIKVKAINLKTIEQRLESLLAKKLVEKKNDVYVIELKKLGFNKILSTGKITKKFEIKCDYASEKAVEKIKESGGTIVLKEKKIKIVKEKPKKEKPAAETTEEEVKEVEEKPKEKKPAVQKSEKKVKEKPVAEKKIKN